MTEKRQPPGVVSRGPSKLSARAAETDASLPTGSDSPLAATPNLATLDQDVFDIAVSFYASGVTFGRHDGFREGYLAGFYDGGERADANAAGQFAAIAQTIRGRANSPSHAELVERRRAA